jgi:hypothetical protein
VNTLPALGEAAVAQGGTEDAAAAREGSSGSVRHRGQGRQWAPVGSRVGSSDGRWEAESATAAVSGAASGSGWRHRGLVRCGQLSWMAGRWAAAAQSGRGNGGGGIGRCVKAG